MKSDYSQVYEVQEKLGELEEALLNRSPEIPTILRTLHRQLKRDEELVTLLVDEECAILVNGLKKQTATNIATNVVKKKTKAMKDMQVGTDL